MSSTLSRLEDCILFKGKCLDEIKELLSQLQVKEEDFSEGETVFSPIELADRIGIILSGAVDVQKLFPNGKVVILERKNAPDIIGASCVFSKYDYYPDNIIAHKATKILFITTSDLLRLFAHDTQFLLNFLEVTSNAALLLKHKIGILSLDSIQEKIAGYLIHYFHYEADDKEVYRITLPFSKKAWAEYMDVSRTSLSRELRKLETEGVLSFYKRTITVLDMNRLNQILSL